MNKNKLEKIAKILFFIIIIFTGLYIETAQENVVTNNQISYKISNIPKYSEDISVLINNNIPNFTDEDMNIDEYYSNLKDGRVGIAMIKTSWKKANEDDDKDNYRKINPSGFLQKQYENIPENYLYHRCHLIGWNIGGIDVDERNLMTGTRDFNVKGMKEFEDRVYNYIKQNQKNHVLYRVTPDFEGDNKLANGVNIEAYSIEDNGKLHFNVYIYNVQNGIVIDYATGESKLAE